MFAVPGWSVSSAALKQQTQPSQAQQSSASTAEGSTPNSKNKNNKRKRGNDHVTSGNVNEMYRKHIEGHDESKPWKKKKEGKQAATAPPKPANDAVKATPTESTPEEGQSKKKQKKNKKNKGNATEADKAQEDAVPASAEAKPAALASTIAPVPPTTSATLTPLQQAMRQKLISSRFRHLNETLYTTDSSKAVELFNANPELFDEYHAGFSRQVKESWPSNPVDGYIQAVRRRGAVPIPKRGNKPQPNKPLPLPRRPNGTCNFADLGCGDAAFARALTPSAKKLNLKLNSYDLQAPDPLITKADISKLPLEDGSVDVTIFCLSLMGTNWVSFVEEAWRVLRSDGKGECWVSEVKSRFGKVTRKKSQIGAQKPQSKNDKKKPKKGKKGDDADSDIDEADIFAEDARPSTDNDETDISAFVEVFRSRGFVLRPESLDKSNKMFVKMEFVKQGGAPTKGKHATGLSAPGKGGKRFVDRKTETDGAMTAEQEAQVLKPCVYKIR
ncbi:hypothetical protein N7462_011212 [Penicillium macrosclerotiorum]|uniref:uncharacterized protein n=1 Tax=Penicillium macrosclerotiorum TaxID=303699 RepID=UPI0025481BB6|nr:uncharacterized protein N7462_011212 [Penicillium macrosclerotiorum]KAJ5666803.1 hypothetical protein N7462_011212 [Penicillium macrosclerotiorum]